MPANQREISAVVDGFGINLEVQKMLFGFLANSIHCSNEISSCGWVLYEMDGGIVLSIRNFYLVSVGMNLSNQKVQGISVMVAKSLLNEELQAKLLELGCRITKGFESVRDSKNIFIPWENANSFSNALLSVQLAHEKFIQTVLKPGKWTNWPGTYNPAITQFLINHLETDIPDPAYFPPRIDRNSDEGPLLDRYVIITSIHQYLLSRGYTFQPEQIACFYTALQTKGFVILSGISGTGKTKLAQLFAEMLPQPKVKIENPAENLISITVQPDHLERGRFIIPRRYASLFEPLAPNIRKDFELLFGGRTERCSMKLNSYDGRTPFLMTTLRGGAVTWFTENYHVGSPLLLKPEFYTETNLFNDDNTFRLVVVPENQDTANTVVGSNCLFLSVRPDWRDSKSLLGYYNPLSQQYEWTRFLEFIMQARDSYNADDGQAWFLILDEMNLARVEYYFADLLSVLESGRDEQGYTREPLRFQYPEEAEGTLPPAELKLPPNLYIVGTVNVDETTQAFSPKVLDRAFSMEFLDVDFASYRLQANDVPFTPSEDTRQALLAAFTRAGKFAQIDKTEIAAFADLDEYCAELARLNAALQPFNHHAGYRVFDEIMAFLVNAGQGEGFSGGLDGAFDQAVLMKVLPKFHGSRGKLEKPLRAVLEWCAAGENPLQTIAEIIANPDREFNPLEWRYPATARRTVRLLQSLNRTGFASFG